MKLFNTAKKLVSRPDAFVPGVTGTGWLPEAKDVSQEVERLKAEIRRLREQSSARNEAAERKISYLEEMRNTLVGDCSRLELENTDLEERLEFLKKQQEILEREKRDLLGELSGAYPGGRERPAGGFAVNSLEKNVLMRSKNRDDDDGGGGWLLGYSDFTTLLLCVFVVLFSLAASDMDRFRKFTDDVATTFKGGSGAGFVEAADPVGGFMDVPGIKSSMTRPHELDTLKEEILRTFEDYSLGESLLVAVKKEGVEITLREGVTFVAGDARLIDSSRGILDRISVILAENDRYGVVVEGHTDDTPVTGGPYPSNWELSTARATNVVRYFVDEKGLESSRFTAAGFGDNRPVAENDSPEGRAANRRVVMKLVTR